MNLQNNNAGNNSFNAQPLLTLLKQQTSPGEVLNLLDQVMADQMALVGSDENANCKRIASQYELLREIKQAIAAGCGGKGTQE